MWAPDYITKSQLAKLSRINDTDDEFELEIAISTASRTVDRCAGRQFGKVEAAEIRRYTPEFDKRCGKWFVDIDDLYDAEELTVTYADEEVTDFELEPLNARANGKVYERIVFEGRVSLAPGIIAAESDSWGWPAFPKAVQQATAIQANRFFKRKDSPYGVAGSPSDGSETRLLAKVDPDVAVALRSYRRNWWAV